MPTSPLAPPRRDGPPDGPPPSLRAVAELLHRAAADDPGATFAYVADDPPDGLALGRWPVPAHVGHPADPLIGFRAPDRWRAVGLTTAGLLRCFDDDAPAPEPVTVTVLVGRDGQAASILDGAAGPTRVLEDPPSGWAADALARVLGRPTPPPADPPALWLEATWLDRIAAGLLPRPGRARRWRWLADRHPLAGVGPTPSPAELAGRTAAHDQRHPWPALRRHGSIATAAVLGPDPLHPPSPGRLVGAEEWFDDGAYARWLLRRLPPPEVLLPDLLAVLPPELGADLRTALVAVPAADRSGAAT